ncbi:MAG: hypothetical protein AAGJ46_00170 [Planctomycetota bacterium]
MNRRSLLTGCCFLAAIMACVMPTQAQTILVGGSFLNGDFNADTDPTDIRTYTNTPVWENTGGAAPNQEFTATRTTGAFNGTRHAQATDNPGLAHGADTGYTIQDGDTFNLSYVWRDVFQWDDAADQMQVTIFTTDNDAISGARTELATAVSGLSTINNTFESFVANQFYTVSGGPEVGQRLFVEFEGLDGNDDPATVGFAKVENFVLSVGDPNPTNTIDFAGPGFSDGQLLGQQGWNAAPSWNVSDAAGSGAISTDVNGQAATYSEPIVMTPGETMSYSVNFEFEGEYTTATTFTYLFSSGLRTTADFGGVAIGDAVAADANIQVLPNDNADKYRLLSNFSTIPGSSLIGGTEDGTQLDPGDELQFDYEIVVGPDAATTFYTVNLTNLTDGVETGASQVIGVDEALYTALTGDGAYAFVQRLNPNPTVEGAPAGTGLTALTINSIASDFPAFSGDLAGDFNDDGIVDAADFTVWRDNLDGTTALPNDNNLGTPVGLAHYELWRATFGSIAIGSAAATPEPASAALLAMAGLMTLRRPGRRR